MFVIMARLPMDEDQDLLFYLAELGVGRVPPQDSTLQVPHLHLRLRSLHLPVPPP